MQHEFLLILLELWATALLLAAAQDSSKPIAAPPDSKSLARAQNLSVTSGFRRWAAGFRRM